jgi:hypothetical protein
MDADHPEKQRVAVRLTVTVDDVAETLKAVEKDGCVVNM